MEQEQIQKLYHETTDEKYRKFLADEGWKYEDQNAALAGYARLKKSMDGKLLSLEEFLAETSSEEDSGLAEQLYHRLLTLAKNGALTPLNLYLYAKHKWCLNHPEAAVVCQTHSKRWVVNNCDQQITEDRAKLRINSEWGFEASRIKILGTPYYDATDWNFIVFRCGPYDWVMCNGGLEKIYQ